MRRIWMVIPLLVATSACSGSDAATQVEITGFTYRPFSVTVERGVTVTWTNNDKVLHTVTSGRPSDQGVPGVTETRPAAPDGAFEGILDGAGTSFSFTFNDLGSYTYYCDRHPGMVGRVIVR